MDEVGLYFKVSILLSLVDSGECAWFMQAWLWFFSVEVVHGFLDKFIEAKKEIGRLFFLVAALCSLNVHNWSQGPLFRPHFVCLGNVICFA